MKFSRDLSKVIPNSPLFVNKDALDIIENVSRETFSVQSKPLRAPCASGDGLLHAARNQLSGSISEAARVESRSSCFPKNIPEVAALADP